MHPQHIISYLLTYPSTHRLTLTNPLFPPLYLYPLLTLSITLAENDNYYSPVLSPLYLYPSFTPSLFLLQKTTTIMVLS